MAEPRVLNTGSESSTETTYVSGGTESASVGNAPRVLGSQSESNSTISGGSGVASASVGTEAREIHRTEDTTETQAGESGTASASVATEARESVQEEQAANVNMTNVRGVATGNTNERSLTVSRDYRAGRYERNASSGVGFERSKGEKNIVNTITVEEVKALIKELGGNPDTYTREEIDDMMETIRQGQYVEVDTEQYPTLEQFLASEGEQGTVYLYPVGNEENNYYQYIWEVSRWVSLGTTQLDISNMVTTDTDQDITGVKTFGRNRLKSSDLVGVSNIVYISPDESRRFAFQNGVFRPNADNAHNLGASDRRWKAFYLAGKINANASTYGLTLPDTSEYTADKEIATTDYFGFKIILAPSSTTLTDGEIADFRKGVIFEGTFLNMTGLFKFNPCYTSPTNYEGVLEFTRNSFQQTRFYNYSIDATTKVISLQQPNDCVYLLNAGNMTINRLTSLNNKTMNYYRNNVYPYVTNSTTGLKYEEINDISISADTTFTLASAPSNTYPEYKANITNTDTSNAITITLPSGTVIKGNVTISSNTFEIPADSSVELNIQNGKALVMNWGA